MEWKKVKVVFNDDNVYKVIKGTVLREDVHTFLIECERTREKVMIGKGALVKLTEVR